MTKPNRIGYTRRRDQLIPDQTLGYDTANAVLGLFSYLKYHGSDAQIDLTTIRLRIVEDRIEVTADDPRQPADPWTAPLDGIEVRNPLGMRHQPQTHTLNGYDDHPVHECHPDRCGMWATTTTQPPTQARQAYCGLPRGHAPHPDPDGTVCGGYPPSTADDQRRTPLTTPTPGRCICGNEYDDTPAPGCCPVPERHDNPR